MCIFTGMSPATCHRAGCQWSEVCLVLLSLHQKHEENGKRLTIIVTYGYYWSIKNVKKRGGIGLNCKYSYCFIKFLYLSWRRMSPQTCNVVQMDRGGSLSSGAKFKMMKKFYCFYEQRSSECELLMVSTLFYHTSGEHTGFSPFW